MSFVSPTTQANHVREGSSPSSNSNPSWFGIGGGPQAISYAAIMEIMAMMNKIMDNYSKQAATQAKINQTMATAARDSTIASGEQQKNSLICEAVGAGVSAVVSTAGMAYKKFSVDKGLTGEVNANKTTKTNLDNLSKTFDNATPSTCEVGKTGEDVLNSEKDTITTAKLHSKNGLLEAANGLNPDSLDEKGNKISDNAHTTKIKQAFTHMSDDERTEFRAQLRSAQDENSRDLNNIYTSNQTRSQSVQMFESMANSIATAATKGASAKFTTDAATHQGDATLQNSVAQQSASNTANVNGELGKAYDKEMQALQMLSTLSQANRA
jgi:hypothetical protein